MLDDKQIENTLRELDQRHLLRWLRTYPEAGSTLDIDGKRIINFSSNDYLDLARHPHVIERSRNALERFGAGSTSSRLVTGTLDLHAELEAKLAKHKKYPAALVFGSGYMTNAGVIPTLVGPNDLVFTDKLIHASILDAIKLSGARLIRFHHNDPEHLCTLLEKHQADRRLVIIESIYSMDGDIAPIREIASLVQEFKTMFMVDEAHSTGIFGRHGAGLVEQFNLQDVVDVAMGTISKGLGGYGGFIACSSALRELVINTSRSFVYTTAPPPAVIAATLGALEVLEQEPERGQSLLQRADQFRTRLQAEGLNTMTSACHIIPIHLGDNELALSCAYRLYDEGVLAIPIRPPTVPPGSARLRMSVTLGHTDEDIERAIAIITKTIQRTRVA